MDFHGKVAVVTGGQRGIGKAITAAYLAAGASVAVIHNDEQPHQPSQFGPVGAEERFFELYGDVSQSGRMNDIFGQIGERWGRIDILVNCAGITERLPLTALNESSWERMMAVNLKGQYLCVKETVPLMLKAGGGSIINISSIRARLGFASDSCYIAAKGGIESFTRALAVELAGDRIRVNCIAPGAIETDFNRERLQEPAIRESTLQSIPLGRIGGPDDVAGAALFLASDLSAFITGVTIPVDGGQLIKG
ncbi:SDR family NAD(P)-dependent oxidoreductase [Paenibacillus sp. GYB004]|uniref:SDR family NAD(P)-dependent oxidoreductase n=1 Tax=Paenibacillus sp. GYB004 TaxID=2994393 RepID=UPI002F9695D4